MIHREARGFDDANGLESPREENAKLRQLLAEAELEKAALKNLAEGSFEARTGAAASCRSAQGSPATLRPT